MVKREAKSGLLNKSGSQKSAGKSRKNSMPCCSGQQQSEIFTFICNSDRQWSSAVKEVEFLVL